MEGTGILCATCLKSRPSEDYISDQGIFSHPCRSCKERSARNSEKRKPLPDVARERARESNLRQKYGIGIEDYASLLSGQAGVCLICSEPPDSEAADPRRRALCVDHDHLTGRIRGLLCWKCNVGLGSFRDSEEILAKAIEYLKWSG